jgi:hypothetical protein
MRRFGGALFAMVLGVAVVGVPAPAAPQAVQLVAAIGKYVGLTAAFAEAINGLADAVAATYETGRGIADDVDCRRHKAVLQELVIELRDVQAEKQYLHNNLVRAVRYGRGWRQLRSQVERVRIGILDLEETINENKHAFADNAPMSRAYANLLVSFDAKQGIVRDLVEEMNAVEWDVRQVDERSIEPQLETLERLEAELKTQITAISEATDTIADHAGDLCREV